MTDPKGRAIAANLDLERISTDLHDAQTDLALLERLKSAQDRVTRLTAEQAKAIKERDKAVAAEAKAAKDARFAAISNVRVTESGVTLLEHVLRSSWHITWTKPTWDGRNANPLTEHSAGGFTTCPPDVLDYLIEICPEQIPAKIMALAPDDPTQALNRYFVSTKRGYVQG